MLNQNLLLTGDDGYNLTNSLRFRSSASAYLNRTPASAGNRKTWTYSIWLKEGSLGTYRGLLEGYNGSPAFANRTSLQLEAGNKIDILFDNTSSGRITTTQVFRDPSAWYHFVFACDTTQATASNRFKLYVNGNQITAFDTASYPSQNYDTGINNTQVHNIGKVIDPLYFDGYLDEINFIDGQALTASSFGEFDVKTGVWKPKKYTGTYGNNGFYLDFADNTSTTTLGYDRSGNGNNFSTINISLTAGTTYDSMTDVPTLTSATAANYCVLNPLVSGSGTISNGNLQVVTGNATSTTLGSMQIPTTGKWYFEYVGTSNGNYCYCGISDVTNTNSVAYYANDGNKYVNNTGSAYGATYTNNDVIGVAVNSDSGTITFYKNNSSQGDITYTISDKQLFAYFADGSGGVSSTISVNFGQRPFAYTPPTGFVALNTFNLPNSTIVAGNKQMDATLYTGNGGSLTVTNAGGFQPDFIWTKVRSTSGQHVLNDSVRGANKTLYSSLTNAEQTNTAGTGITAFNSNGYTLGTQISGTGDTNGNGSTYVAWQWKAGGAAVTNTAGTISAQVSANTTSGFSVVTYTGTGSAATVGHGLGVAPKMIIVKNRNNGATDWAVYHANLTSASFYLWLNSTQAQASSAIVWNNTAPTSTVFSIGTGSQTNGSTNGMVAYCWSEVAGFSKFGSYTGNGSADGPFVFTGFRPRFVLVKCSSSADNWSINDSSRDTYNAWNARLYPDLSNAENAGGAGDFLSNGFKLRSASQNTNGATYIYMAFAESPFKYSLGR